jgi:hypothetical protein
MAQLSDLFEYAYTTSATEERHTEVPHIDLELHTEVIQYRYGYHIVYECLDVNKEPVEGTVRYQTVSHYSELQDVIWTDSEYDNWVDSNKVAWKAADKLTLCGYAG